MSDENDNVFRESLIRLIRQGYTVKLYNEKSQNFNEKYLVYKEGLAGNKLAVLDKYGNIVGQQG